MESNIILLVILAASILGKANSVAIAACMLLIIGLLNIDKYTFPYIENHGMFIGLVLLIAAILIPIANGKITSANKIGPLITSGILALGFKLFHK